MSRPTLKQLDPRLLPRVKHPAQHLAELKLKFNDAKGMIAGIASMPYPADPLVEPELEGLTYYQVGLIRLATKMVSKTDFQALQALEFFTDRQIGKAAQTNLNVNVSESYTDFLKRIAQAEGEVIDVAAPKTEDEEAEELGF